MPPTITAGTGTATDGASVTLTGSGFGSKATAAPLKFDTFEGTGDGAGLDGVNGWKTDEPGDARVTTVSNPVRPGSTRAVQCHFAPSDSSHNFFLPESMGADTLYLDFWFWFKLAPGSNFPDNYKLFRLYNTIYEGPNTYQGYAGGAIMQTDQKGEPMAEPPYWAHWVGPEIPEITAGYTHCQFEFVMGADPSRGGTMKLWVNGGAQKVPDHVKDAWQWRKASDPPTWNAILFGNYAYSTANGFDALFSDLYLDTSRARLELGDAADYNNCTHREIVPLTAHSDTSLTATLRKGSFGDYGGLHLFVVDDAGHQSVGFPVASLGAGGGVVDPPPIEPPPVEPPPVDPGGGHDPVIIIIVVCPQCGAESQKSMAPSAMGVTTVEVCANCGHRWEMVPQPTQQI